MHIFLIFKNERFSNFRNFFIILQNETKKMRLSNCIKKNMSFFKIIVQYQQTAIFYNFFVIKISIFINFLLFLNTLRQIA